MSNMKREDPRATRTKKVFKSAVLSLLLEDSNLSQLTVQKIANRAELNRATFYLHYQDINDLLEQITNEMFDELSIKLRPLEQADLMNDREQLVVFLDHIYVNRKLLSILFEQKRFEPRLFGLLKHLIESRRAKQLAKLSQDYVSIDILTSSIFGIITWWIRDGLQFSSEYIADQISMLYRKRGDSEIRDRRDAVRK
ncbi:TetR/AcrR family transcriptional regulator [Paenibacillus turpanensis]|uniref:TetR/AcrR family transcriptional regulator n=1 Tax=Paenibacillus turpanensis TaxID=2689078 RepID=UPI001408E006|nr:TetR/AcrR family transcriptional regulator [Paenibacillus turpanensis]